jgi:uncharacterized protein (TIGR02145 family)
MINKHSTNPENPKIGVIGVQTILAAALGLAITFTLSCSSGGGGGDPTCGGRLYDTGKYGCVNNELVGTCGGIYYNPEYERCLNGDIQNGAEGEPAKSSSSKPQAAVSSSSSVRSSSSLASYESETYQTVVIGTQTWMARNLNYAVEGGKCYGEDGKVMVDYPNYITLSNAEIQANCDTYGRLYNWATAMALPDSCNSNSCSLLINAKHRGICPSGWHIPSNADWDKLVRYVDGSSGTSSPYDSPTAGRYLKATSGWYSSGNGEDKYSFSALPGGLGYFRGVGLFGIWWSASEYDSYDAYYRDMGYDNENVYYGNSFKNDSYSVRCVQD